jgi:DNA-binding CsgD family transcriptional regulator
MGLEPIVPRLHPPDGCPASPGPDGELFERARDAIAPLVANLRCAGYLLAAWDPLSGTHVHRELASDGYPLATIAHINDEYILENPTFGVVHTKDDRVLRWRELARDWDINFSKTRTAEEFLIPEGIHEGTTVSLRLRDGRYTGAFHVSWSTERSATDEQRETIHRFRHILANVCDMVRVPRILAENLPPDANAIALSARGAAAEIPGRGSGSNLGEGGALRQLLMRSITKLPNRRFLWIDPAGGCHRVDVMAYRSDVSLVTEQEIPWPHDLTGRELQILHLIAAGLSNPQIAERLFVSWRTVSKHVEHILSKLGCASRAQLAGKAVAEGLILGEEPRADSYLRSPGGVSRG